MSSVFVRLQRITTKYPIVKGMLSYGVIWPVGCIIQQTMDGKRWDSYDWKRCLRFCLYGGFVTAPTLYGWIKISSAIWPKTNFRVGVTKALVEVVTYGPLAMATFFFFMALLDGRNYEEAKDEVKAKFLPSYKVALCVWPVLQTINFSLIPERNRVPFVSVCSLMWSIFLAYMQSLQKQQMNSKNRKFLNQIRMN